MAARATVGIVGGGFAGLYTVFYIRRYPGSSVEVVLFDKNNYLLYTAVLHEMATGTVDPRHVSIPIREAVSPVEFRIRCEEARSVDLLDKALETGSGIFKFDHLVLAHGSETNFYSFSDVKERSLTFKTIEDAVRLRNAPGEQPRLRNQTDLGPRN
jgi:NADH:ubiquinone reductase (H+-translocating)